MEIKARLDFSKINGIRKKLLKEGAIFQGKTNENDIYFTSSHRDFIKTKECLRIRERGNYLEMTYKGPTTKAMENKKQFWKTEINIPLICSKKEAEIFLQFLGFIKVVEVKKEREKIVLKDQEIIIDKIEDLGWFLEIESKALNKEEEKAAVKENLKLLKRMGIKEEDIVSEPYRDLFLKNETG